MKGNAFSHHARLVSSPADHGFQLQRGTGCLWICRAIVVLEEALHFLLLGVSQPVYKKSSKGKALKGTSYSCVPFQLLTAFLFLCVPCNFYFSLLSLHTGTRAPFLSCPGFLSPLGWGNSLQCEFPALLLLCLRKCLSPPNPWVWGTLLSFQCRGFILLEFALKTAWVFVGGFFF